MEYAELANLAERVKTPQVFLNEASPLSGKFCFDHCPGASFVYHLNFLVDVFAGSAIFQLCTAVQVTPFSF